MNADNDTTQRLLYPLGSHVSPQPGHERLLAETVHWALRHRVVEPGSRSLHSLERMRSDLATVLAYPGASGERAQFISDFIGWYLLLDDAMEVVASEEHCVLQTTASFERCFAALTRPDELDEEPRDGLARGALDLARRARSLGSSAWRMRFYESIRTYYYQGVLHEITYCARGTVPGVEEFTNFRVESSGSYPIFDLIELAAARELPLNIAAHPTIQQLRRAAAVVISWANDIASFHKEQRGSSLNYPLLLMHQKGICARQALDETTRIHNAEIMRFMLMVQSALCTAVLDTPHVPDWLHDLQTVMRGLLEWQMRATRYTSGRSIGVRIVESDFRAPHLVYSAAANANHQP